ncbi:hypothetical protein [Rhizobiales bacterium 3FA27D7]|jgi:hypothetical protein|uniref:hypothetical protein n=1 Tax=Mesorhizobium sp. 2RAF21 TaxID=3232995 RepID=UPI0010F4829A
MTMLGVFYKGGTDNYGLHSCSFDGTTWRGGADVSGQPGGINAKTDKALGACLYENRLYVAYKGWTSDDLYIAVFDGTTWGGDVKIRDMPGGIDARSNTPPALIVFNDLLHIFYKAHDGDQIRAAWFDGLQWAGGNAIAELAGGINPRTDTGPCAVVFGNKLYLFYMGAGGIKLYSCWCDGATWGDAAIGSIDPWSDDPPTAAVFGGKLFLVYRGAGSQSIFVSQFDGTAWSGDKAISGINPQTDSGPSLIVFQNRLCLVYKGKYTESLYVAWYDGTNWSGDVPIDSQAGGIGPSSDAAPMLCLLPSQVPPRAPPASNHVMDMVPKTIGGPSAPAVKKGTVSTDYATPAGSKDNLLAVDQSDLADPLICDINLVGTHDSAAIRDLWPRQFLYACQNLTIGRQLDLGIRVLDVRLEMFHDNDGQFTIYTCHGDRAFGRLRSNRYQTLQSLLDECKEFLRLNPREFIAMLLQVDYWNNTPDQAAAYRELGTLLVRYPIINSRADMPRRSGAAGNIYLINRMNDDPTLGVPIHWDFNIVRTPLAATTNRNFVACVQDLCDIDSSNGRERKLSQFWTTAAYKTPGQLMINFGSGNIYKVVGVYIHAALIARIGALSAASRPRNFGWSLFDFPDIAVQTDKYGSITLVDLIKDAASGYARFKDTFAVTEDGRAQLVRWEPRP